MFPDLEPVSNANGEINTTAGLAKIQEQNISASPESKITRLEVTENRVIRLNTKQMSHLSDENIEYMRKWLKISILVRHRD